MSEPYVAVIFTSRRTVNDVDGYAAMAERMDALAAEQPGYRGIESVRDPGGLSITISYWRPRPMLVPGSRSASTSPHRTPAATGGTTRTTCASRP